MASKSNKFPDNIPGPYYVDNQCISCNACVNEAPDFFGMNDSEGHALCKKQPQTPEDKTQCESAKSVCPVEAIGSDG